MQANNTHSLATSLQNPTLTKAGAVAAGIQKSAAETSAGIYPNLSPTGRVISGTTAMMPDLLLSGGAKQAGYKIANVAQQAVRAVGEGKAIGQAIGQALIPGNTIPANTAANLISDQVASSFQKQRPLQLFVR